MSIDVRPPSVQWEPLALAEVPGCQLWSWFFPAHAPSTVTISIPPEAMASFGRQLTARRVIAAVGWPIEVVTHWSCAGVTLETQAGANPVLDQPFPAVPGVNLEVVLAIALGAFGSPGAAMSAVNERSPGADSGASSLDERAPNDPMALTDIDDILAVAEAAPAAAETLSPVVAQRPALTEGMRPSAMPNPAGASPMMTTGAAGPSAVGMPVVGAGAAMSGEPQAVVAARGSHPNADAIFAAIEADWRAIETLERQLAALTKQMNGQAGKLQSLNRDLTPQERLSADSNDIKDWSTVRRLLRDAAANISKHVRAFDIGTVSAAGNRNQFADIFTNFVQKRIPFDGMEERAREFESHRKVCQSLLGQSSSALSGAQRDAEGKARALLSRIAAKARAKR